MEHLVRSRPDIHRELFIADRQFESLLVPFQLDPLENQN
jgi:hypothetical protein